MPRRIASCLLLVIVSLALSGNALAAGYSFRLPQETVNVYWQSDGTVNLDYVFVFANEAGASPIDYVDVGLPTSAYLLHNIAADVNGQPITDIQTSTYVKIGVALGLGSSAIAPGATGKVHVSIRGVGQVLYPDDQDATYASAVFSPTWFDAALVHGATDLTVIFHLPPGVQSSEPRYHTADLPFPSEPQTALDDKGQVTYTWQAANANGSTQYLLGASFPAKYVTASAIVGQTASGTQTPPPAYSFQIKTETATLDWKEDGTVTVDYVFEIANAAGAPPLDSLAVPLPGRILGVTYSEKDGHTVNYRMSASAANIILVDLSQAPIAPGVSAAVHVYAMNVAVATQPDAQHAGNLLQRVALPTFSGRMIHGPTDLTLSLTAPTGMARALAAGATPLPPAATLTGGANDAANTSGYRWHAPQADASKAYSLQLSFPASFIVPPSPTPGTYTNYTRSGDWGSTFGLFCVVMAGMLGYAGWIVINQYGAPLDPRRLEYLPPQITIEGHGIKRGLTAVEAAVLLERPLDTVLTMILFSVLKKGAARLTSPKPLVLEIARPISPDLYDYERDFLEAFDDLPARQENDLQGLMIRLVKSISEKMRGFSRNETLDYYRDIVQKAWQDVQAADTPDVKSQKFDELMDWTMLDGDFAGRSATVLGTNPLPVPLWWGRSSALFRTATPAGGLASAPTVSAAPANFAPSGLPTSLPGADFAASIANGVQTFSAQAVGDVQRFTAHITDETNPPPVSSESHYHGGGGHCACACACAGCACACAGGGR